MGREGQGAQPPGDGFRAGFVDGHGDQLAAFVPYGEEFTVLTDLEPLVRLLPAQQRRIAEYMLLGKPPLPFPKKLQGQVRSMVSIA